MYLLNSCPLALALGKEVEDKKRTLIWEHGHLPYLALDATKCKVTCPEDNRWTAVRVSHNVPIFSAHLTVQREGHEKQEDDHDIPSLAAVKEIQNTSTTPQRLGRFNMIPSRRHVRIEPAAWSAEAAARSATIGRRKVSAALSAPCMEDPLVPRPYTCHELYDIPEEPDTDTQKAMIA